jgi:diguanylate cyclase (GGDEF)-like protein
VYRWGGEEFLVLLPEQSASGAAAALARLCRRVQDLGVRHEDGGPEGVLSISVGYASWEQGSGATCEDLLAGADAALYVAKAGGRNRVSAASCLPPGPTRGAGTAAR